MKILFIAMPHSIHTVRWVMQLKGLGWDIHFCSSTSDHTIHSELTGITYHYLKFELPLNRPKNNYCGHFLSLIPEIKNSILSKTIRNIFEIIGRVQTRTKLVETVIKKEKPDIIHTLETQSAGYLVANVKDKFLNHFPFWIHSNWGIDLHFFGRLRKHIQPIRETLLRINALIVEGQRDALLAQEFGYKKLIYIFPSVGGGFVLPKEPLTPLDQRNLILIKGTQDECRRGLVAIRGLERCVDLLGEYQLILYTANDATRVAAELFEYQTGKEIVVINEVSHEEMLALNSKALISICVNRSDGLPNAMLEAMLMGAFPIQSNTSLADEWIKHGHNGLLVNPDDPEDVELSIREALNNPQLLKESSIINRQLISENLKYDEIREKVINLYQKIYQNIER